MFSCFAAVCVVIVLRVAVGVVDIVWRIVLKLVECLTGTEAVAQYFPYQIEACFFQHTVTGQDFLARLTH
jgi:hypothetical protein